MNPRIPTLFRLRRRPQPGATQPSATGPTTARPAAAQPATARPAAAQPAAAQPATARPAVARPASEHTAAARAISAHLGVSVLHADAVTRRIDDQVLLAPTTLTVGAGQCLAVRGQNGAGKTTLLRILAGQLLPSDGHGTYAGHTLDERSPFIREHVASLIGPPVHYTDLTLAEHLDLIWATWGTAPALRVGPAQRAALNRFGIDHLGRRFPHELSSGQSQMFHLASTFARPFSLLILDEPEQRLDPQRKDLLARAIEKARMDGAGIVLTSHDADLSTRLATSSTTLVSTQDLQ